MMALSKGQKGVNDMSVGRNILANLLHVNEEDIKCENCSSCKEEWCNFWNATTSKEMFCSLWLPKNLE